MIGLPHYLVVAAGLFAIGAYGVLTRRNILRMLLCLELMLNGGSLAFAACASTLGTLTGQMVALFIMVVAAAEITVALAILVVINKVHGHIDADRLRSLKW